MKYSITLLSVTLVASMVLFGCGEPSNKMERAEVSAIQANRDVEIAKAEVESELRVYRLETQNQFMENNREISEIRQKINNETDAQTRARHEERLRTLEATHRDLKLEMDNYKVSSRDNWSAFRNDFGDRMDDFGDSLNNFFSASRATTSRNQNQ